ncbi:MAG: cytochrome b/b6 domain-containing protein [Proteobacteria bacterium]|nr:cytochrome b/b6 domain-containing protein [Pseudomonadota bacterium]
MAEAERSEGGEGGARTLVWDLPLRVGHWALATAVAGAFVTDWIGPTAFPVHALCGEAVLVLVAFRLLWGVVGPAHARFTDFVRGPRAVWASLPSLTPAGHRPRAGHTPLGGWMVLALLGLLAVQATLGLFANDDISHTGPLYGYVEGHLSNQLSRWHGRIANAILVAVALHVGAALYYRRVLGEDLVRPLLTGRKRGIDATEAIDSQRIVLALAIAAALVALLAWVLATAPEAALDL